jgi:PKD repeat protein
LGYWTLWSDETSFTTVTNSVPSQPENWEPDNSAAGVALTVTLEGCEFRDPNTGEVVLGEMDTHAASQWQVTASSGNYSSPAFDSLPVNEALTSISVPQGKLSENTTYYWHVRYQDSYGSWSAYSQETSFTTGTTAAKPTIPKPVASFSADKTEVVAGQDLVTFSDNSTPMAEIDLWAWDFGDGSATENWTSDMRPPNGKAFHKYTLAGSYTVKLTVSNGAAPAPQGQSTTVEIVVHAKPEASFTLTPAAAKAGKEITCKDASTPTSDITSWEWQFDDGDTVTWTAADRQAADGELKHAFKKSGTHTVTLIVKGPLGESYYNKQVNVTGAGGFKFGLWMIAAGVGLVVVIAGVVYLLRARKGK